MIPTLSNFCPLLRVNKHDYVLLLVMFNNINIIYTTIDNYKITELCKLFNVWKNIVT